MASHTIEDNAPELRIAERRVVALPLEVHYYIIEFLDNWEEAGTILNCALVCRRWLPFSQLKLYSGVPLYYRHQWMSFKRLILHPPLSIGGYLPRVRELHIHPLDILHFAKEGTVQLRIGWGKEQERPWAHLVLIQCAAQLDGLTSITFWTVDWTRAQDLALSCGSNYCYLTTLLLRFCTFKDVGQLHLLVTAFPALDDLCLQLIILQSSKPLRVSRIPKAGHSLTSLTLTSCGNDVMAAITACLVRAQMARSLVHLRWGVSSEDNWKTITEAIDSPGLQTLKVAMPRDRPVNLAHFRSLETLQFEGKWITDEDWTLLNRTLSSVSSSRLEELTIRHWNDEPLSLDCIFAAVSHLKAIDDTLARPQFTSLCHVVLIYWIEILIQAIPVTSDTSPFRSRDVMVSNCGSSPQPHPANDLVNSRFHLDDPQHSFWLYVEPLVRHGILEELKQLGTRDILDLDLAVWINRPPDMVTGSNGTTRASAAASTYTSTQTANNANPTVSVP